MQAPRLLLPLQAPAEGSPSVGSDSAWLCLAPHGPRQGSKGSPAHLLSLPCTQLHQHLRAFLCAGLGGSESTVTSWQGQCSRWWTGTPGHGKAMVSAGLDPGKPLPIQPTGSPRPRGQAARAVLLSWGFAKGRLAPVSHLTSHLKNPCEMGEK